MISIPCAIGTRQVSLVCEAKATIEGNPEHDLRIGKVLLIVPNFPNGHIRIWTSQQQDMLLGFYLSYRA
jgi:hypothetical protein